MGRKVWQDVSTTSCLATINSLLVSFTYYNDRISSITK